MEDGSLFEAVVHHVIGRQVSAAAQATIWTRLQEQLGVVTPETVGAATAEGLRACGTTFEKVDYIKGFAAEVESGAFDIDAMERMSDAEAIAALCSPDGTGTWTAEMLLLFNLGRLDILSFGDLAIHHGMRMVCHHRRVTCKTFERYRRRTSPYGSVASLYLWSVSHMDVPGYGHDYAPKAKTRVGAEAGAR